MSDESAYRAGPPLEPESPWFFGRDELMRRLRARATENPIIQVHGPRRSGKTTVLLRVVDDLRRRALPAAYVDISEALTEMSDVEALVIRELQRQFPELGAFSLEDNVLTSAPVLVLDEIEVLEQASPDLLDRLHREASEGRWRIVEAVGSTIGRRQTSRQRHRDRFALSEYLDPFDLKTAGQALREPSRHRLEWTDAAIRRAHVLTGGLPLFVNALGDAVWHRHQRRIVDAGDVDAVAAEVVREIRAAMSYVWFQGADQRRLIGWQLAQRFGRGGEEPVARGEFLEICLRRDHDEKAVTEALEAFAFNWVVKVEHDLVRPTQPLFWRAVMLMGEREATAGDRRADEADIAEMQRHASEARWQDVRRTADKVLRDAPQDSTSLRLRAQSMWHEEKRAQAIDQLREVVANRRDLEALEVLLGWIGEEARRAWRAGAPQRADELIEECRALDPDLELAQTARVLIERERRDYQQQLIGAVPTAWPSLTRDAMRAFPARYQMSLAAALCEQARGHFEAGGEHVAHWLAGAAPLLFDHLQVVGDREAALLAALAHVEDDPELATKLRERLAATTSVHAGAMLEWALEILKRIPTPLRALVALAGTRLGQHHEGLAKRLDAMITGGSIEAAELPALVKYIAAWAPARLDYAELHVETAAEMATESTRPYVLAALSELPLATIQARTQQWLAIAVDLARQAEPSALAPAEVERLRRLFGSKLPPVWLDEVGSAPVVAERPRELIQQLLGRNILLSSDSPMPFRIAGSIEPAILMYHGTHQGERVSIRVFDLKNLAATQRRLLEELWANEQRSLYGVGLRTAGRALVRLHHAVGGTHAHELIIAVTDDLSRRTLRDVLDASPTGFSDRRALWRSLAALYEGVRALHNAGCMHRAIRPESTFVVDDELQTGGEYLRLGTFEFSVYLTSLARRRPAGTKWADRYSLPATTRARLGNTLAGGESLSGDVYGLALLTFELLVRPFERSELARAFVAADYNEDEHRGWIESLRGEVKSKQHRGELTPNEALVFTALLDEALEGGSDLDGPLQLARACMLLRPATARRREYFAVTTTTTPGRPQSFATFVLADLGEELPTEESVLQFLRDDLRAARVYASSDSEWRLLIYGKRLAYRARPFVSNGQPQPHIAFLEVARGYQPPRNDALAELITIETHAYGALKTNIAVASTSAWQPLFDAASRQGSLELEARQQLGMLQLSLELEADMWERSVYEYTDLQWLDAPAGEEIVRILDGERPAAFGYAPTPLPHFLRQLADREGARVDLSRRSEPTAPFHPESAWTVHKSDDDEVLLRRRVRPESRRPAERGYLRPFGLAGSRAIYQRRGALLGRLSDDAYLLQTMARPGRGFDLGFPDPLPVQSHLDRNKRDLARVVRNRRPMVLVQGPPGTGKTTLAAEIILEALRDGGASRILVTAQSHEPLNNMLRRVDDEIRRQKHSVPVLSVRLAPEERFDSTRWGEEAARIGREFSPGEIARAALLRAHEWNGGDFPLNFVEHYRARIEELAQEPPRSIAERVVAAANIVYATTNDRALHDLQNDSFDLVIVEEAARALPLELLGPMSLGRRWLLIGDHQQLPPFGLDDMRKALRARVQAAAKDTRAGTSGTALPAGLLGFDTPGQLEKRVSESLELFRLLHGMATDEAPGIAGSLSVQWRMHPRIGAMLKKFYPHIESAEGEDDARWHHSLLGPGPLDRHSLVWIDMPHCTDDDRFAERAAAGGGFINHEEVAVIGDLLRRLVRRSTGRPPVPHFLSPYRAQVKHFRKLSERWRYTATAPITSQRAETVDSFQGRQADTIILSLVRNNSAGWMGFLDSEERATVAFSRAQSLLIVVGCSAQIERSRKRKDGGGSIRKVYEHISEHGLVMTRDELLAHPWRTRGRS